jgi:hypothetical protein
MQTCSTFCFTGVCSARSGPLFCTGDAALCSDGDPFQCGLLTAPFSGVDYVFVLARPEAGHVRVLREADNVRIVEGPGAYADLSSFGCLAHSLGRKGFDMLVNKSSE